MKGQSPWDIEKGTVVIVEPIKRTPVDSVAALEKEIIRSIMPQPKSKAEYYFMQGAPEEREYRGMREEDIAAYIREINDIDKFALGKGATKRRKRRRTRKTKKKRHYKRRRTNKRH